MFNGHIIFLEEYNIGLAKILEQGVDVWVNTPILGHEACGTSGMKVGVNGGVNFSTKDGWWEEAYDSRLGWEIESMLSIEDIEKRNDMENMFLMNTLESEIAPLYYEKGKSGFNPAWVARMKNSINLIACHYNTCRMAHDYINNLYCPAVLQLEELEKNNYERLKNIVAWKTDIIDRFNTLKIKAILINGIKDGKITSAGIIKIKLLLFAGKLTFKELKVEFILTKNEGKKLMENISVYLSSPEEKESGVLTYEGEVKVEDTGFYSYAIRVFPYNELLLTRYDAGVVYWG